MNTSFDDIFWNKWVSSNSNAAVFILNQLRNNNDIDYLCFVEGPSDSGFYKNIGNAPFKKKNIHWINSTQLRKRNPEYDKEWTGKKGVINGYFLIKKAEQLNKYLNKCIFIVDHDYDGLIDERLVRSDYNNFTITKPYAFENYFLDEENLKKIFDEFGISDKLEDFNDKFAVLLKDLYESNRLISSITATYIKGSYYYSERHPNYRSTDNFRNFGNNFNFLDVESYDKTVLEQENKEMYRAVSHNDQAKRYYINKAKYYNQFSQFNGHTIYNFLKCYLKQVCGIDLTDKDRYKKIVNLLDVDLDIKTSDGTIFKEI